MRFPRYVYGVGTEPDPRFSLANERTFLAWIRTALGLAAASVALDIGLSAIEPDRDGGPALAVVVLAASAVISAVGAWVRWAQIERALRLHRELPGPYLSMLLALVIIGGLALAVVELWRT